MAANKALSAVDRDELERFLDECVQKCFQKNRDAGISRDYSVSDYNNAYLSLLGIYEREGHDALISFVESYAPKPLPKKGWRGYAQYVG